MQVQTLREGIGTLDPKIHGSLVRALAKRCDLVLGDGQDVIPPPEPSFDPFAEAYGEAVDGLNTWYKLGAMNYVRERHPGLHRQITRTEGTLEEIWSAGIVGADEVQRFRDTLGVWVKLYHKGVELFSEEKAKRTQ